MILEISMDLPARKLIGLVLAFLHHPSARIDFSASESSSFSKRRQTPHQSLGRLEADDEWCADEGEGPAAERHLRSTYAISIDSGPKSETVNECNANV